MDGSRDPQATNSDEAPDVGRAFLPAAGFPAGAGPLSKQSTPGGSPAAGRNAPHASSTERCGDVNDLAATGH
jgi:hypothetical protein